MVWVIFGVMEVSLTEGIIMAIFCKGPRNLSKNPCIGIFKYPLVYWFLRKFLQGRNLDNLSIAASLLSFLIHWKTKHHLCWRPSNQFRGPAMLPRHCCCLKSPSPSLLPLILPGGGHPWEVWCCLGSCPTAITQAGYPLYHESSCLPPDQSQF